MLCVLSGVSLAQTFSFCLDICAISNVSPPISFTCRDQGRSLNVSSVKWGCSNATATSGTTDQQCGDPSTGTQMTEWIGGSNPGPSGCRWQVSNQQVDDTSQFVIAWGAANLANLGVNPVFNFAAILSNPPPPSVDVTVTSLTNGVATRCIVNVPLSFTASQPQQFTAAFSAAACPAAFNSRSVSRFTMVVNGPAVSGTPVSFALVQTTNPIAGPCVTVSPCPRASFTVVKATTTTSVSAPGTIPYTITINNNGETNLTNLQVTDPVV